MAKSLPLPRYFTTISGLCQLHTKNARKRFLQTGKTNMPLWWNWQTRWTQNPVVVIPYRFDPDQRHHVATRRIFQIRRLQPSYLIYFRKQSTNRKNADNDKQEKIK